MANLIRWVAKQKSNGKSGGQAEERWQTCSGEWLSRRAVANQAEEQWQTCAGGWLSRRAMVVTVLPRPWSSASKPPWTAGLPAARSLCIIQASARFW